MKGIGVRFGGVCFCRCVVSMNGVLWWVLVVLRRISVCFLRTEEVMSKR